jgi:hypothetical protein
MPYVLNGEARSVSAEPQVWEGRHYVPLAPLVEQLGGMVKWDNNSKTADATIGQWTAHVQDGNPDVDVNGTHVQLAAPPVSRTTQCGCRGTSSAMHMAIRPVCRMVPLTFTCKPLSVIGGR